MAVIFYPARQIAAVVESAEGTQTAAGSVAVADLIQTLDPQIQLTPNRFERNLARRGFGMVPSHYAKGTARLTFGVELAGNTDNASALTTIALGGLPKWSKLLEACGSVAKEVGSLGTGAITGGPIQHGETITATVGGNTAVALGYTYTPENPITVELAGAALAAGGATTSVSSSTFTIAGAGVLLGNVLAGYAWHPKSVEASNKTLTFHLNIGGQRFQVYGARGTCSFAFNVHDRVIANFTFDGIFDEVDASAALSETGSTAFKAMTPPAFVAAASTLTPRAADGTFGTALSGSDLCWDSATFDLGVSTVMRKCANGTDGYIAAVITGRAPTFSFNPDDPGVASYEYIEKLMEGTQARGYLQWGTGLGNRFLLKLPHLQAQTTTIGERDTRMNQAITYDATLGSFEGAADRSVGFDNEWLLVNY